MKTKIKKEYAKAQDEARNKKKSPYVKGEELRDSFPVYHNQPYFCDDEVIYSEISGDVYRLKDDLRSMGNNADRIYIAELV